MISMDRNTSPISPFTSDDYKMALQQTNEHNYPFQEIVRFKENYAEISGWLPEEMELANGSDEWLQKLMIVYGQGGVLSLAPDFVMYQDYADQIGVEMHFVKADQDFNFELKDILQTIEEVKPQLFILSNPHNPTGRQFEALFLQTIADAMERIKGYFVIDEAYIEFGSDYSRPKGDHVIILRTMSKIYGMAGLRIGILKASGQTFKDLTKINHPYPVNSLALNLATQFLEDSQRVEKFKTYQLTSRDLLLDAFKSIIFFKPTASNFIFTYGPQALQLGNHLRQQGFQGRFYQLAGMEEVVRYSIIQHQAYPQLKEALQAWQKGH